VLNWLAGAPDEHKTYNASQFVIGLDEILEDAEFVSCVIKYKQIAE
jgi:hypothetical protein